MRPVRLPNGVSMATEGARPCVAVSNTQGCFLFSPVSELCGGIRCTRRQEGSRSVATQQRHSRRFWISAALFNPPPPPSRSWNLLSAPTRLWVQTPAESDQRGTKCLPAWHSVSGMNWINKSFQLLPQRKSGSNEEDKVLS